MALSTKYRSNPYVLRDTKQMLTIQHKAFANNIAITVNGVLELSRYIASVSAYITSDRLILENMSLASINHNATINVLEENGWDHRCCKSRNLTPSNTFTVGRGVPATKIISNVQSLGSSSIASPKTISQLMVQSSNLTNTLPARDYTGNIALTNAPKTMNAQSGKKIMGDNAFASCARLASVRMSSDNTWNAFYSNGCFKSCSSLTTINTITNSNSSMSRNVAVDLPVGTISAIVGSATVTGTLTQLTTIMSGQMLFTGASSREDAKYIGTVKSVQSNTQFTLVLPSVLSYSGTFRIATEAMIAAHITTIGQEALRGTNIRVASIESHLNPTVAASNSKLTVIGSNAFIDCPFLSNLHFSVKQSSGLTKLGNIADSVIPLTSTLSFISSDGWTPTSNQAQLSSLINVAISRMSTIPKFTYSARLDPTVLDSTSQPMRIATITGLAMHDGPISCRNLVIPQYIAHSDGKMYQVYDIKYPYIDQIETIVGQPNRVYGAFNKSNPAFSIGVTTGSLSGILTLPNSLRSIDTYAFEGQSALSGDLTVTCPSLSFIGSKCFSNSYGGGKTLTILNSPKITLTVGAQCFANASFNPIVIRSMTNSELISYAF